MKTTKFTFMLAACIVLVSACGSETATSDTTAPAEEPVVVIPDAVTIPSGNTFEIVKESAISSNTFKYTLLDYTTNSPIADVPIDGWVVQDDEQLLKIRIEVELLALSGRLCEEALDAFSIITAEGAEEIQIFQRFTADFKAGLEPTCLEVGAKEELTVYFMIPADADLSNATLSLYRGSDYENATVKLNP